MKKILITSLITAVALCGLFAQETRTFNDKTFTLDYIEEFDDEEKFKNEWTTNNGWRRTLTSKDGGDFYTVALKTKYNTVIREEGPKGTLELKDGVAVIKTITKELDKKTGYVASNMIMSGQRFGGPGAKNGYLMKSGSVLEVKFKMPMEQGSSLAIYLHADKTITKGCWIVPDSYWFDSTKGQPDGYPADFNYVGEWNENNYIVNEFDFCEITNRTPKYIMPRGTMPVYIKGVGVPYTEDPYAGRYWTSSGDNYGFKSNNKDSTGGYRKRFPISGKEWYDQWHILTGVWDDYSVTCLIDGVEYKKITWDPEKVGKIAGEYQIIIAPEYLNSPDTIKYNLPDPDKGIDFSLPHKYEYQFDYVKVFKKSE